jgi:hypothetical protein
MSVIEASERNHEIEQLEGLRKMSGILDVHDKVLKLALDLKINKGK